MQTIKQQENIMPPPLQIALPPLNSGDHLSRSEFEQRYNASPEIKKAELIEGVVYMPSPTRLAQHAEPHAQIVTWLGVYSAALPGLKLADNASIRLDFENEVQPDVLLRITSEFGGQTKVTADDYLEGPPELIVEIAASSAAYDLHEKKRVYARNGVREYLVIQIYEQRITWFVLRDGVYQILKMDEALLRSEIFPGLWLQIDAFWANDLASILNTLQTGLTSAEHKAFVAQLNKIKG